MAAGMGDERKPLGSGDRWQPTASDVHALHKTADYVEGLQKGGGALPQVHLRRELGTVVLVRNDSSTGEDWPIWSPIGVCAPPGSPAENVVAFANRPYFRGCRMNDYGFDSGFGRMLGITQEPIPYGKMGRVCIRGLTPALLQKSVSPWYGTNVDPWVHVHYEPSEARWSLRGGPAGDARLLRFLDTNLDQDDECLVLLDLCDVPNRMNHVIWYSETHETLPANSLVFYGGLQHAIKLPTTITNCWAFPYGPRIAVSPNWDVPAGKRAWMYVATEQTPIQCRQWDTTNCQSWGPAPGEFLLYPGMPGFRPFGTGWWKDGTGFAGQKQWVLKDLSLPIWAKAKTRIAIRGFGSASNAAWIACQGVSGGIYDGSVLPEVLINVKVGRHNSTTAPRTTNIAVDRRFLVLPTTNDTAAYDLMDPSVWDDPIGTVKMWIGNAETIPDGWREYTALAGKYLRGSGGSASTHTHGGVSAGGSSTSAGDVPHADVTFIERYQ